MLSSIAVLALLSRPGPVRFSNGLVSLILDRASGRYSVEWPGKAAIRDAEGEAGLGGETVRTSTLASHRVTHRETRDRFGRATEITFRHGSASGPQLLQTFRLYRNRPEVTAQLAIVAATDVGSNYLAPLASSHVSLSHRAPLRCLFVPWDNDMYFRYRSDGWGEGETDWKGSYEVGGLYDDSTRRGLIVGSLDHDVWKSAVRFQRNGGLLAFAGATSKYTHDTQPHGTVRGRVVSSPRMVLGLYSDWRSGLERFGDLNALVKPPLPWRGGVPFGWSSWSGHKTSLNPHVANEAIDFVAQKLPGLRSDRTATMNLDAFWDSFPPAELQAYVEHAHRLGLKAGIYWAPFALWGQLSDRLVEDPRYTIGDIVLKGADGKPLPRLDGAYPLDPTHPGTLARIDTVLKGFVQQGYDYVKLDFLSHGATEGKHFDPAVTTGNAAYVLGMKRVADDLSPARAGRPIFLGESIAPMFPYGSAHARRISCDVFANIGASEYLLNSTNYGWWPGGRLYRFNDPDSACVYQPKGEPPVTEAESRTRCTASVISGGMMLLGDDLTNPAAEQRVLEIFGNAEVLDLARRTPAFQPVNGGTGSRAGDAFVWHDRDETYVALFNFSKTDPVERKLPLQRLGLAPGNWSVHDLWTGRDRTVEGRELDVRLAPMDCVLLRLTHS